MKNNKGITLVALVVTIVVLLILAGVSINLVLGNNGIIAKAKDAETKSAEASQNDLKGMNGLVSEMEVLEVVTEMVELEEVEQTQKYQQKQHQKQPHISQIIHLQKKKEQ